MKQAAFYKTVGFLALMVLATPLAQGSAGRAKRGITGDWQTKVAFGEQEMTSILSFSKDKAGKLAGKWISFWGLTELKDLKYEGKELSFVQVYQFGDREFRTSFAGTIKGGKLTGTLSSERGESKIEGKRIRPMPKVLGSWEMKVKVGEREYTGTLVLKTEKEGKISKLTADWQSERGEHQITDVKFKAGKLTFTRKSKIQDREWESTFEGTVKRHALSGIFKSERGEVPAEGKRLGAALVGKWELEIASERGSRKQILQVNPDLSGLYGSTAIKKVDFEDGQVSFKIVLEFGERKFEISFKGKLDGRKLAGELTTSRGAQKVTGKKVISAARKG